MQGFSPAEAGGQQRSKLLARRLRILIPMIMAMMVFATSGNAEDSPTRKHAQPALEDFNAKQREIRELFGDRFGKGTVDERQAFARDLLRIGKETTDDPLSRFVLLFEASVLAARSGDIERALESIRELAHSYDINEASFTLHVLEFANRPGHDSQVYEKATEAALQVYHQEVHEGRLETARKASQLAHSAAGKSRNYELLKSAKDCTLLVPHFENLMAESMTAVEVLRDNPTDPAANEAVGKYEVFVREDWDAGLPKLAMGENDELRMLAALDSAHPKDPESQIKVGDLWWDYSGDDLKPFKLQCQQRALYWYERALPRLSGLTHLRIEQRIGQARQWGIKPQTVDLLQLVEPRRDAIVGTWEKLENGLVAPETHFARVGFPYSPPAEYVLQLTLTAEPVRKEDGAGGLVIGLGNSDFQAHVVIDVPTPTSARSSLENIIGEGDYKGFEGILLVPGKPQTITCIVEAGSIIVRVGETTVITWHGRLDHLAPNPGWTTSDQVLSVGAHARRIHISAVELTELSGRGSLLP